MRRRPFWSLGVAALLIAGLMPQAAVARTPERFGHFDLHGHKINLSKVLNSLPSRTNGNSTVMVGVEMSGQPVATYVGNALDSGSTFSEAQKTEVRRVLKERQANLAKRLTAVGATVHSSFTDVFNGFRVSVRADKIPQILRLPGVTHVYPVATSYRNNANTDHYLGADKTWGQTGFTGAGVKIAVIDTGINYDHRDFGGAGFAAWTANDGTIIEPGTFPTAKVVGGYDLVGDAYTGGNTPVPDPDPLDCKDPNAGDVQHGTHVSGTAAGQGELSNGHTFTGPYNAATLTSNSFRIAPGVAPEAKLMAFRVFGCDGSTNVVVDAIERAVQAGADVINMSLGSPLGNPNSMDTVASNNAALAGTTVVASAGNEGPSSFVTGSPATATRVISVAAMDAQEGFPGATIDVATGPDVAAINANNGPLPVTGTLNRFQDDPSTTGDTSTGAGFENLGCFPEDYTYNAFVVGQIAVVDRGICARVQRAQEGQSEGAAAVIMINNASGFPPFENTIAGVTIPFLGVSLDDAATFTTNDGTSATATSAGIISNPTFKHTASFTSAGPRRGDLMLKPDVTAPGVSVFSADGGTTNQGKTLSGTSMASPATAGVAALVKQAHPSWLPRDIKAAIVGTASPDKLDPYVVRLSGAGLATPRRAVDTQAFVYTDPGASSLTFGYNQLTQRAGTTTAYQDTRVFTIRNTGASAITYDLSNTFNTYESGDMGLNVAIWPTSITVPGHSRRDVQVTLSLTEAQAAALPDVAPGHAPLFGSDDFGQDVAPLLYVAGAINATPTSSGAGIYSLRVPWLVAPRGLSGVQDVPASRTPYVASGSLRNSSIRIKNYDLHPGIADVYSWGLQDNNDGLDGIDLRAGGVQTVDPGVCDSSADPSDRCLIFAVNTWGHWNNASENEFDILLDLNHDGTEDAVLVGIDAGIVLGFDTGIMLDVVINLVSGDAVIYAATAPVDGSTLLMPALASELGLSASGTQGFNYIVKSFDVYDNDGSPSAGNETDVMKTGSDPSQGSEWARYNAFHPALSNGNFVSLNAGDQFTLPLTVHRNRFHLRQGMLGWLVVTLEDANGEFQADTIPVGRVK